MAVGEDSDCDLNSMWQDVKSHFRDSLQSPNPLRQRTHLCELSRLPAHNDDVLCGFEIDEDAMTIFAGMGDTSPPPCTCDRLDRVVEQMDGFIHSTQQSPPQDYSFHTKKPDKSIEEIIMYSCRDALQWWVTWMGSLQGHYWKHLYIAFITIPDEIAIPPQDLANGLIRVLGHTFAEVLAGLRSENLHPDDIHSIKMLTWRQYICQYLEKVDPDIQGLLRGQSSMMAQWHLITSATEPAALAVLASRTAGSLAAYYDVIEMASLGNCLSLSMAKENFGILKGEATETVAGGDRNQLKRELRWLYVRSIEFLDLQPAAPILRRYATSGFHYVFLMDRYRERF